MKKILSLILVITCFGLLMSCDMLSSITGGGNDGAKGIDAFVTAIENTNPKNIIVDIEVETSLGELTSKYTVNYNDDGSAVITYTTEKFNAIGEGAEDELKSTVTGTVTKNADGTFTGDTNGVDVSGVTAGFKLDVKKMKDTATINENNTVLTATVAAADTEAVLGTAYDKDVTVVIAIENGVVELIDLTFEGGSVSYKYN